MATVSRGIRNNNPGNIRRGQSWQGLSESQTDGSFDQFVSPEYGIRAIEKILISYKARGIDSIVEIINTWAPKNENDTDAYINAVSSSVGVDKNSCIDVENMDTALKIIKAIIKHENGTQPYSDDTIKAGIRLAGVKDS